jgi:hypothetical protein
MIMTQDQSDRQHRTEIARLEQEAVALEPQLTELQRQLSEFEQHEFSRTELEQHES